MYVFENHLSSLRNCIRDKTFDQLSVLYWNQAAKLKIKMTVLEFMAINRGVRQGCVLSLILFNIYSETILEEALHDISKNINKRGTKKQTLNMQTIPFPWMAM